PLITIGHYRELAVLLQANHATIALLVDGESALLIEREPVRAGLTEFTDVHSTVAALGHEDRQLPVLRPTVDQIVVGIAEKKIPVGVLGAWHPDGTFGKQESSSKFLDLGAGWNNLI